MMRFTKMRLFEYLEATGSEVNLMDFQAAYEEFLSKLSDEFIKEPDLLRLYQSLTYSQLQLDDIDRMLYSDQGKDVIQNYVQNASAYVKSQLKLVKWLIRKDRDITRDISNIESTRKKPIKWTKSKTDLVEFAYAAVASGSFNHGNVEIKELLGFLSETFEVSLGNFYDTFIEIRRRKGSRTIFLDEMVRMLTIKMDDTDNKSYDRFRR
ncbi:RteC domain-containing protein [Flavobacterium sp. UBA4197]|uniref:RteC domain-containing protein n=1 Tax=Flavobacterium sp. UBA4197 TaxID=1946546 RepID=UPI00257F94BF|nr:RteC domain-containing protein [Flavobacterium sp. UBA4197]